MTRACCKPVSCACCTGYSCTPRNKKRCQFLGLVTLISIIVALSVILGLIVWGPLGRDIANDYLANGRKPLHWNIAGKDADFTALMELTAQMNEEPLIPPNNVNSDSKIALLFMIGNKVNNPDTWANWIDANSTFFAQNFQVMYHASQAKLNDATERLFDDVMSAERMPTKTNAWCGLVGMQTWLFYSAYMKFPSATKFILISESHIPLKSMQHLRRVLVEQNPGRSYISPFQWTSSNKDDNKYDPANWNNVYRTKKSVPGSAPAQSAQKYLDGFFPVTHQWSILSRIMVFNMVKNVPIKVRQFYSIFNRDWKSNWPEACSDEVVPFQAMLADADITSDISLGELSQVMNSQFDMEFGCSSFVIWWDGFDECPETFSGNGHPRTLKYLKESNINFLLNAPYLFGRKMDVGTTVDGQPLATFLSSDFWNRRRSSERARETSSAAFPAFCDYGSLRFS